MGICNICNINLNTGALFTAECSHIFHYNCIFYNLQNGTHICPICHARWTQVPSIFTPPTHNPSSAFSIHNLPTVIDPNFNDDEPLPSPATSSSPPQEGRPMTVKALPEYPALSKSNQCDSFAVLVSIKAPLLSPEAAADMTNARAPLDLVAVLDVSGSMYGHKIKLLKEAVSFVIKNLGPNDRLSIITFSTYSHRLTPLRRMTESGQTDTLKVVDSIRANGSTNIIAGLQTAVKVLEQRRVKNPVTSIILLSDGQDTDNHNFISCLGRLPQSIRSNAVEDAQKPAPSDIAQVYTFGFGADHDAKALHAISDGSGGTFSYIEAIEVIQDAFAQCLGGLLSVVAQQVEIEVRSGSPDVRIKSIPSGRYRNTIDSFGSQHGVVYVGDVYADEEKQFLVYLSVPPLAEDEKNYLTTKLLEVKCSYKNPISKEKIVTETASAEIRRPLKEELSEEDKRVCLEVDREKNRVSIAEGIAQAQDMAERGELDGARSLLERKRKQILQSYTGMAGDAHTVSLHNQAGMVKRYMSTEKSYLQGGRAFAFSAQSSHMYQRAATQVLQQKQSVCLQSGAPGAASYPFGSTLTAGPPGLTGFGSASPGGPPGGAGFSFQTSYMQQMVKKSQQERQSTGQNQ